MTNEIDPRVRDTFTELLRIVLWAQACVPETLIEHYGDVGPTIARAEMLLKEMDARQRAVNVTFSYRQGVRG